jgi:hypothetical protein
MWDRRLREHPHYRTTSWPGTALRICDGAVELVELLADLDERDLSAMLPERPSVPSARPSRPAWRARTAAVRAPR